jgi:hypothetical protein
VRAQYYVEISFIISTKNSGSCGNYYYYNKNEHLNGGREDEIFFRRVERGTGRTLFIGDCFPRAGRNKFN